MIAQVHDLLRIDPDSVNPECPAERLCIKTALTEWPWVVVRRDQAREDRIAVGVRGATRADRWPGFVAGDQVRRIVRPEELLQLQRSSRYVARTPALKALRQMDERWCDPALCWGPVGSSGFELASGHRSTHESSDLDLIIRAPARIPHEQARQLWEPTRGLSARVDVRVETPRCGFSLEEYARSSSAPILLRYPHGVKLHVDPWNEQ